MRKWILKHQAARALSRTAGTLVPVSVIEAPATSTRTSKRGAGKRTPELASGWLEIELGAARVIVRGKVEAGQLRLVFDALGAWR